MIYLIFLWGNISNRFLVRFENFFYYYPLLLIRIYINPVYDNLFNFIFNCRHLLVLVTTFLNVMSIYALLSPSSHCINYNSSERTITISCISASLDDIYNKLHNNDILSKQQFSSVIFFF